MLTDKVREEEEGEGEEEEEEEREAHIKNDSILSAITHHFCT